MRATGAVQRHLNQSLIQRCHELSESINSTTISQGLGKGLAQSDAHILVGVMVVDMRVTNGMDIEINQSVAADLVKHVIKKRHTGAHLATAAAIEIQTHPDIGFAGDPVNLTLPFHNP